MSFSINSEQLFFNNKDIALLHNKVYSNGLYLGSEYFKQSKCKHYAIVQFEKDLFNNLKEEDLINDVYISFYNPDIRQNTICDIWKKNDKAFIFTDRIIYLSDWDEHFSLKKFIKNFPKYVKNSGSFSFSYGEHDFIITTQSEVKKNDKILDKYNECKILYKNKFREFLSSNNIESIISFSPEHLTAGSSILQYFGKLLQERYPNEKVSVSIKQEDLKVTMTVETPDGKKEEIEEYLNKYGLVISNQITPQEFTSNPIQVLELETKLESAKMEIGFQKKLLALKDKTYDENLVSLKDEVKFLRTELSSIQTNNNEQIKLLLSSLSSRDKLIKKLTKSIDKKDELETKQLLLELKDKDNNGYIGLKQHLDNAMIGGIVNAPSWIQFTMGIITKL